MNGISFKAFGKKKKALPKSLYGEKMEMLFLHIFSTFQ